MPINIGMSLNDSNKGNSMGRNVTFGNLAGTLLSANPKKESQLKEMKSSSPRNINVFSSGK